MTDNIQQLLSPALRAKMGDWVYYMTAMRMEDIANRVMFAEEIHPDKALSKMIQRQLEESHSQKISEYLLSHPQRFFNSLVVGIYKGDPQWLELDIRTKNTIIEESGSDPDLISGMVGLLLLSGNEKIFAIDGQHRVAGIRQALIQNSGLADEKVSVIFVAHRDTGDGIARTRRLFTSLNRYAKPVSPLAKIALDEDDVVAIVTRRLIEEHSLFKNRILDAAGVPLSSSNKKSFTTVVALYKTLDTFLPGDKKGKVWAQYKKNRPEDFEIDSYYELAKQYWNLLLLKFNDLRKYVDDPSENPAQNYRNENGGHVLFRPLGIMVYARVINQLINNCNLSLEEAITRISKVPTELAGYPWNNLVWNSQNKTMMANSDTQQVACQLLFYFCGGDLSQFRPKSNIEKLKNDIAALQKIEPSAVRIEL